MSATCPLFDDQLPLETKNLKKRQVEVTLQKLMAEESTVNDKSHSLEVLARLCWSDDNSRKCVSDASGISLIKTVSILKHSPKQYDFLDNGKHCG